VWQKIFPLAVVALVGPVVWLTQPRLQAQSGLKSAAGGVSLVAVVTETGSLAWSARSLPAGLVEPGQNAEFFFLEDQSVLARGQSSEVRCEWEAATAESSGLLPLSGFPGAAQLQWGFLPSSPSRELILPRPSTGLAGRARRTAAFVAIHASAESDESVILRIKLVAF